MNLIVSVIGVPQTIRAMQGAILRAEGGARYVGSNKPYAARIELGFHGFDSLGRLYNQGPRPWLLPAALNVFPTVPKMVLASYMAGGRAMTGLEAGAEAVQELAQILVPVDTGELQRSIEVGEA